MSKQRIKKTVFFIVEGNTDKTALEGIFKGIYRHKDIRFAFTNGDVTSDEKIDQSNIQNILYNMVKKYIDMNKLKKTDIWQIVQIFDTDGAYIPDDAVVVGESKSFFYSTMNIACKDRQKVLERNLKKRAMIDFLLPLDNIRGIPYRCYYMSSNLDHALYNKQNLEKQDKTKYADKFYAVFLGQEKLFIKFLELEAVNDVPESFPESWKYIKEGVHSLERHTNIHIYFKENPYE